MVRMDLKSYFIKPRDTYSVMLMKGERFSNLSAYIHMNYYWPCEDDDRSQYLMWLKRTIKKYMPAVYEIHGAFFQNSCKIALFCRKPWTSCVANI